MKVMILISLLLLLRVTLIHPHCILLLHIKAHCPLPSLLHLILLEIHLLQMSWLSSSSLLSLLVLMVVLDRIAIELFLFTKKGRCLGDVFEAWALVESKEKL